MCIAILNTPKGEPLTREILKNCWQSNSNGAGYVFVKDGKLTIHKQLSNFEKFYKKFSADRLENPDCHFLVHFRITTHGKTNLENCHPFLVNDDVAFIHNGILSGFDDATGFKSDTALFNDRVLKRLPDNFIKNEGIRRLIRLHGGSFNKFIFLTVDNDYRIINEEAGHWVGGNWFSNKSYESCAVTYSGGYWNTKNSYNPNLYKRWNSEKGKWDDPNEYTSGDNRRWTWDAKNKVWIERMPSTPVKISSDDVSKNLKKKSEKLKEEIKKLDDELKTVKLLDDFRTFQPDEKIDASDWGEQGDLVSFTPPPKRTVEESRCTECDCVLNGRMEKYYGVCTGCLKDCGLLSDGGN